MNNQVFIPSHGLGEIYLNIEDNRWYGHNSSCFDYQNEIPFFKLLHDMASLCMRYYLSIDNNRSFLPQTELDLGRVSTYLLKSFIKIRILREDLFFTGDTETLDFCMETYRHYINKEPLAHNIFMNWDILSTFKKMKDELFNFSFYLQALFSIFYQLFPKKLKFRNDLLKTEQLFKKDLMKQFKKFVIKNGKYSSKYIYFYDGNGDIYLKVNKNYYENLSI